MNDCLYSEIDWYDSVDNDTLYYPFEINICLIYLIWISAWIRLPGFSYLNSVSTARMYELSFG